jgi:hypothetical protein
MVFVSICSLLTRTSTRGIIFPILELVHCTKITTYIYLMLQGVYGHIITYIAGPEGVQFQVITHKSVRQKFDDDIEKNY